MMFVMLQAGVDLQQLLIDHSLQQQTLKQELHQQADDAAGVMDGVDLQQLLVDNGPQCSSQFSLMLSKEHVTIAYHIQLRELQQLLM
jgi:hypothetical protein